MFEVKRARSALVRLKDRGGVLLVAAVFLACLVIVWFIPVSPAKDSYTLVNSLKYLCNGAGFTDYMWAYYNFFGNNKIALLVYRLFASPFLSLGLPDSVVFGIRAAHVSALFAFALASGFVVRKIFGSRYFLLGVSFALVLFPYALFTAPYGYPLSFSLAAVCLCFGLYDGSIALVGLASALGALFALRPSAGFFVVVVLAALAVRAAVRKDGRRSRFIALAVSIAALPLSNAAVGLALRGGGLHPYPNFSNASTLWTLYVGTNLDGADTGKCYYKVDETPDPSDRLAVVFHEMWLLAGRNDAGDAAAFGGLKAEAAGLIRERAGDTIFRDASSFFEYLGYKTKALFDGSSSFVSFGLNAASDDFAKTAALNITRDGDDYKIFMWALTVLSLGALIALRKKARGALWVALPSFVGAIGAIAVFVALTEVGAKLWADVFPACYFVVLLAFVAAAVRLGEAERPFVARFGGAFALVGLGAVTLAVYAGNDAGFWRYAETSFAVYDDGAAFAVDFKRDPPSGKGYGVRYGGGELPLAGSFEIRLRADEQFELLTPEGVRYVLTHDPVYHERWIRAR